MSYALVYAASLAAFLVIDALWLSAVMKPLFDRHVGEILRENMIMSAAAGFYLIYLVGVVYFCVVPGLREGIALGVLHGAALGFLAYGTYEFTNMTTIRGWSWTMVAVDVGWGMALTAFSAAVGIFVGRALGLGAAG